MTLSVNWSIGLFLFGVFFVYPLFMWWISHCRKCKRGEELSDLRGLYLPNGSIRAMLAIAIVGSFILYLGVCGVTTDNAAVISAFGTLSGAVTGFYFAGRTAKPDPEPKQDNSEQANTTDPDNPDTTPKLEET